MRSMKLELTYDINNV